MNVNKKLDRFKQWAGERMGGEVKTSVTDDFKALEFEMGLRQEGVYSAVSGHSQMAPMLTASSRSREDAASHECIHQGNL